MPSKFGKTNEMKSYRGYRKKSYRKQSLSKRLYKLEKQITNLPERKHYDRSLVITPSVVPTIYQLDGITQGDTEVNRTGVVISPKKLMLKFRCNAEVGEPSNEIRFVVFRWFDNDSPQYDDVLASYTSGTYSGQLALDVPTNYVTNPRYQVLSDRVVVIDPQSNDTLIYSFKKSFKKNAKIKYDGASAGAIESGNLFLMVMSDSAAIPHPICQGWSRLEFTDA